MLFLRVVAGVIATILRIAPFFEAIVSRENGASSPLLKLCSND